MRLITIGSDRRLFDKESDVVRRTLEQSQLLDSHLIIVFAKRELGLQARQIGTHVRVVPTNSRSRFFYITDAVRIGQREGRGADLVTTQDPFESGLVGLMLKRRLPIAFQVQIHADIFSPHFRPHSLLNLVRVLLARFIIPRADCVRVVSDRIKHSVMSRFPKVHPVVVLPVYAREHDKGSVDSIPPSPFILVVSRLEKEKGVDMAIKGFARMAHQFPEFKLVIAGDGRERGRLEALARTLNIEKHVTFLGWRADTAALMSHAALLLHTAPSEGYGLVLLEAARALCPIVSTDVGIIGHGLPRDLIEVVPIGNTGGIAEGLIASLRQKTADRGHKAKQLQECARAIHPWTLDEYLRALKDTWALCTPHHHE